MNKLESRIKTLEQVELKRKIDVLENRSNHSTKVCIAGIAAVGLDVWVAATFPPLWGLVTAGNLVLAFGIAYLASWDEAHTTKEIEKLKRKTENK